MAVVQHTFKNKQFTEQHNLTEYDFVFSLKVAFSRNILRLLLINKVVYKLYLYLIYVYINTTGMPCLKKERMLHTSLTSHRHYCNHRISYHRQIMLPFLPCPRCTLYNVVLQSIYRWRKDVGGTCSVK